MRNILITGGAGSIGANFIRYLLEEIKIPGRVINVDALTYAGNLNSLKGLSEKFPDRYFFEKADICDYPKVAKIFKQYQIDTIVHFAAESHVDRSILKPDQFIKSNVLGTFHLLEAARENLSQIKRFHHISTDEVYGSLNGTGFFTEASPYHPNSPYSASKAAADHLVGSYFKTYGLPTTLSNCCNNYGPYHYLEKLIPLCILNALEGKPLPVYGDGLHIRDWLYVRDHCRAIWLILQKGKPGETYNVGGHQEKTNLSVVEMICDYLDELRPAAKPRRELIRFIKDRPGHDRRYAIDFSKIRSQLGYEPEETFESGLRKTIQWYLENPRWVESAKNEPFQKWYKEHYPL